MQNIDLSSNKNYNDYVASVFFNAYGLKGLNLTSKTVETRDRAKVSLVNVQAYDPSDGHLVDMDLWPNKCQTLDDIKAIPENVEDVILRFGKFEDEETGEIVETDVPRIAAYKQDGKWVKFHGARPEWDDENRRSIWNNDPAEE